MNFPLIKINLKKIADNAKLINDRCVKNGISVVGVTKSVLADINIVKVLKRSGISIFGDSRLINLIKLRKYFGYGQQLILLRTPMISECEKLIGVCDVSMQTELETVKVISKICERKRKKHNIIIMVEMDDKREGIYPYEVVPFFHEVYNNYKNINIIGLGTNARCISKRRPTIKSVENLVKMRNKIFKDYNYTIPIISGGNSSVWKFIESGTLPPEVNQVRIGEAIFLGNETIDYEVIEGAHNDCFTLEAEVIEVKEKNNKIYKAILALGLQDVDCKHLKILNPYYEIVGQSSDHTVLCLKKEYQNLEFFYDFGFNSKKEIDPRDFLLGNQVQCMDNFNLKVGSIVKFKMNYFGLLSAMTSPFVEKDYT